MAAEKLRHYQQTVPKRSFEPKRDEQVSTKVGKKPFFTKGEKIIYSLGALLIAAAMIMVVQFSSSIDTLNRDIQTLNNDIETVKLQNTTLEAEVKELSKPSRILTIAEEHGLNIKNATVKQASNMN